MKDVLTSIQVAAELGVTKGRVLALVRAGRLPAELIGVQYLIRRKDLALVRDRPPGRPRKSKMA